MTAPQITPLPAGPTPQDSPEAFNDKAFRSVAAQERFVEEANTLASFVSDASTAAGEAASAAATARSGAGEFKNAAETSAAAAGDGAALAKQEREKADAAASRALAAAAAAHGGIKAYATRAEAAIAAALLPDDADVEVSQDETRAGARTRYKVQAGALVFLVNLDQVRIDLADSTDPGKGVALVANAVGKQELSAQDGASMIGYMPKGAGAVEMSVQSALRQRVSVMGFGAIGGGVANDAAAINRALSSGALVIDGNGLDYKINSSITIPQNVTLQNINIINGVVGINSVLVNTRSRLVNAKITGTGVGGATVERAVYAAGAGVDDVYLDIVVENLTVAVQIHDDTGLKAHRGWRGVIRVSGLVGGGAESNGYGLLISSGHECKFDVYSVNTPRHCVYISNGSSRNDVTLFSRGSGGAPYQLAAFSTQNYVELNTAKIHVDGAVASNTTTTRYAANVVGKCRLNEMDIHVSNSAVLDGAVMFRALDANTVPHDNYANVKHTGGYAAAVVASDSAHSNSVSVSGSGAAPFSGASVVSASVYNGIAVPAGSYRHTLRITGFRWDALGSNTRGVASLAAYAPVDIGEGVLKNLAGSGLARVYVSGGGGVVGYTHRERSQAAMVSIPAGAARDFTFNFSLSFDNATYPIISLIAPNATPAAMPQYAIVSSGNSLVTVSVKNTDAVNAQSFSPVFDVTGY